MSHAPAMRPGILASKSTLMREGTKRSERVPPLASDPARPFLTPGETSSKDKLYQATLETTLGQMAPPKSERVQECHLFQVAF